MVALVLTAYTWGLKDGVESTKKHLARDIYSCEVRGGGMQVTTEGDRIGLICKPVDMAMLVTNCYDPLISL